MPHPVDAEGDGRFDGPGDSVHRDADSDRLPDVVTADGAGTLVVLAFPDRERAFAAEMRLRVSGGDAAAHEDVIVLGR